jgi:hypothetical protein
MTRPCGKSGCHCTKGEKHTSLYLAIRPYGRARAQDIRLDNGVGLFQAFELAIAPTQSPEADGTTSGAVLPPEVQAPAARPEAATDAQIASMGKQFLAVPVQSASLRAVAASAILAAVDAGHLEKAQRMSGSGVTGGHDALCALTGRDKSSRGQSLVRQAFEPDRIAAQVRLESLTYPGGQRSGQPERLIQRKTPILPSRDCG